MKTFNVLFFIVVMLLISGCTPVVNQYRVTVNAIKSPQTLIQPSSYTIQPLDTSKDANDLRFQRQSEALKAMLNARGYTLSNQSALAQEIIYLDYGIEKVHEERRVYREPEVSFGVSLGFPYGYYHHYRRPYYDPFWGDVGYTNYRTYERRYAFYNRYVTILAKDQQNHELWRVDIVSPGESTDLMTIVPLLIEAAAPYLGTNTNESVELTIQENRHNQE